MPRDAWVPKRETLEGLGRDLEVVLASTHIGLDDKEAIGFARAIIDDHVLEDLAGEVREWQHARPSGRLNPIALRRVIDGGLMTLERSNLGGVGRLLSDLLERLLDPLEVDPAIKSRASRTHDISASKTFSTIA
jgi:hypothetical protein